MENRQALEAKRDFLLLVASLRERIGAYKFIHVFGNNKFPKSIVECIGRHFPASEHCFVFIGGHSPEEFPLPAGDNVFLCPSSLCLAVSDAVSKVFFHGLYIGEVIQHLYEHPEILQKSFWIPWGGDLHEAPDHPVHNYVRSNFRGIAGNAYTKKVYEQKYGTAKVVFPYSISFESIRYNTIVTTPIPEKDYIQIQVNNSTHPSTLETFEHLRKFSGENIRVTTILSYGRQEWIDEVLNSGKKIFGAKFSPILQYLPADSYIKLLARNDILILNQNRPQGMTTAFASMLLGKKVFMRGTISGYLREESYMFYDTATISKLSFAQLLENTAKEENKRLAARRFDENFLKQVWQNIFEYT